MDTQNQERLDQIVSKVMSVWIQRQILETAQPTQSKECSDRIECAVSKAIDWRRDYIAALNLASAFKTAAEFQKTIAELQSIADAGKASITQNLREIASASSAEEFGDAVHDLLSPMSAGTKAIFLDKIRRVFSFLKGTLADPEDFKHIHAGLKPNGYVSSLYPIMKEQGVYEEWRDLLEPRLAKGVAQYFGNLPKPELRP